MEMRRGADGHQVIDRHGDGVLGDGVVVAAAADGAHGIGHQRLGAQALDDGGQQHAVAFHDIGGFAARALDFAGAMAGQVPGGAAGGLLGTDLQRVDAVVVDPGTLVIKGRLDKGDSAVGFEQLRAS